MVNSHLNEAQRERLATLESSESSDDDEANDEDVATRGRGEKTKPVRHQLRRTPTDTQQARWEAVQQAREQGLSFQAIARKLGMDRNTAGKYALAEIPPTKKLSAKERAKAEARAGSPTSADYTGCHIRFSFKGTQSLDNNSRTLGRKPMLQVSQPGTLETTTQRD